MADIVGVGGPTRTDLILLGEVVSEHVNDGVFVLAALAVGIAAPSLLFRRRKTGGIVGAESAAGNSADSYPLSLAVSATISRKYW